MSCSPVSSAGLRNSFLGLARLNPSHRGSELSEFSVTKKKSGVEGDLGCLGYMYYRADLPVRNRLCLKAKAILQPISLYFEIFLKAKAIWHPIFLYSLRDVERRPVLCSFRRIEGSIVSTSFLTSMD